MKIHLCTDENLKYIGSHPECARVRQPFHSSLRMHVSEDLFLRTFFCILLSILCHFPCIKCSLYVLQHQPELNTSQSIPTCGHSVIVTIARNFGSTTTSNVFCRKIDSNGSGEGKPFQLQKLKDRPFWENEEVTKEGLKVGCLLEYRVVTYHELDLGIQELFIFCRKVSCKPQVSFQQCSCLLIF